MYKSYLKLAWRNILKNKGFSFTNISGLTIGMTCTLLILLWVHDELSWDKFHPNHKTVYSVRVNRDFNGEITTDRAVPFPLAEALQINFPEVKFSTLDNFGGDLTIPVKYPISTHPHHIHRRQSLINLYIRWPNLCENTC